MARIFISYRRADAEASAFHIDEFLRRDVDADVFLDRKQIEGGSRWDDEIRRHLEDCQVLVAVIGPDWVQARDKDSGKRRLDDAEDWVRREIETALEKGAKVIPVRVGGAGHPNEKHKLEGRLPDLYKLLSIEFKGDGRELCALVRKSLRSDAHGVNVSHYLSKLREDCQFMSLGGIGRSAAVEKPRIDRLYTPLHTQSGSSDKERQEEARRVPLEAELKNTRLLVLGGPGSGKSTFLNRLTFAACETLSPENPNPNAWREFTGEATCPFPIFVYASQLGEELGEMPRTGQPLIDHLDRLCGQRNRDLPGQFFKNKMLEDAMLLVDGLDEPAESRRARVKGLLELVARDYPRCRIVASSRPSAWGGVTKVDGFTAVTIAEFGEEEQRAFTGNWCSSVCAPDKVDDEQRRLLDELQSKPEIEEMARNPLMLTALAVLHHENKRLPEQRVKLYAAILDWMLEARKDHPGRQRNPDTSKDLLQTLAFKMQTGHTKLKFVDPDDAAGMLAEEFASERDAAKRKVAARRFLETEEVDSGAIVSRGEQLAFSHWTFQEYLAARALAVDKSVYWPHFFSADGRGKLHEEDWREVVPLFAGCLRDKSAKGASEFLRELLRTAGTTFPERARTVGLVGRILRDLKAWGYELGAEDRGVYDGLLAEAMKVFEPDFAAGLDLKTRIEAADAIGQAGDPRLEDKESRWIWVEGGEFDMGAQKTDRNKPNYDEDAYDDEAPVVRKSVKSFWMAQYPVTVQEYGRFVDQDREGRPGDWAAQQAYPNRPVVLVSQEDAIEYCKWRNDQDKRHRIWLPTEAQWEYAARQGRKKPEDKYPWGSAPPDEQRANFAQIKDAPMHPTPVGMFPAGSTTGRADGIHDMAGNVWEWTDSNWERDDPSLKSLRGGGWVDYARYLRVSCRVRYRPEGRYGNIGFRLIREQLPL